MVVAMASCSLGVNLNSNCSFEKTPSNSITNWGYSRRVLGFGSKSFCIVQKKGSGEYLKDRDTKINLTLLASLAQKKGSNELSSYGIAVPRIRIR
ncbi:hypothetical protein GBA52_012697 [Prunus armeniaca]|nr:hypothetical protein GBA52_012697 [Prunus armeniaca]